MWFGCVPSKFDWQSTALAPYTEGKMCLLPLNISTPVLEGEEWAVRPHADPLRLDRISRASSLILFTERVEFDRSDI